MGFVHGMHAGGPLQLVHLDQDHPGFRDVRYRERRDAIAAIAFAYLSGQPVPDAPYTDDEHGVWALIQRRLAPLHREHVVQELDALTRSLALADDRIPQLAELNPTLSAATGFRMEPVAGLVAARVFLEHLSRGVFLSTQYIRHHSRPLYTPEPDVVHELVGHAASLMHPDIASLSRAFGVAAAAADEVEMARLESVYWYTLEFGMAMEEGRLKVWGAGLLSSVGELRRAVEGEVQVRPWDLETIARTPYDPTDYQPQLFAAPSVSSGLADLRDWLQGEHWRASQA